MNTQPSLQAKTIGICAHSYEGAALCFLTACKEGELVMGEHMHPHIIMSAVPMALSMPAWETGDYDEIAKHLAKGVDQLAKAGADFFICPDNTAHIVLEKIINDLPIPGVHIAEVVCKEIVSHGWKNVALLGTKWTMTGPVYANAFEKNGLKKLIPEEQRRLEINNAILDELCHGVFKDETIELFRQAIADLGEQGAECVILGCTEIPLIITEENSPLPVFDSTRQLAKAAVRIAVSQEKLKKSGWM
jgi:aspartate racemase